MLFLDRRINGEPRKIPGFRVISRDFVTSRRNHAAFPVLLLEFDLLTSQGPSAQPKQWRETTNTLKATWTCYTTETFSQPYLMIAMILKVGIDLF